MRKNINTVTIISVLFILVLSKFGYNYFIKNRSDLLKNYESNKYEYTSIELRKSQHGYPGMGMSYYLIDDDYYNENKDKSQNWIEEDLKVKNEVNNYSKDERALLENIKNLEGVKNIDLDREKPNFYMKVDIQKDKLFDKESWFYYEGEYNIYLDKEIICFNNLGLKGNEDNKGKKYYYKMDDKSIELANKLINKINTL